MMTLQSVIERDDATTLSLLMPEIYSPDYCLENGQTLLQYAAEKGAGNCVRLLLYKGADANCSRRGLRPLGLAALHGHADIIEYLLAGGVNLEPISTGNAMIIAARAGHMDCVRVILEMGNDFEMVLEALHKALSQGHNDCVSLLSAELWKCTQDIEDFYEFVEQEVQDEELLEFAYSEQVRSLIQSAPPPGTVRQAIAWNDKSALERMLVSGANPSVRYIWSDSTLGEAVEQAEGNGTDPELASLLVAAGADVNAMTFYEAEEAELLFPGIFDIKGEPLSVLAAVRRNDVSALCRMLENGANPDKPLSEDFSTPLIVALQLEHTRCAELLVQAGACLYARDQQGVSPLQFVDKNYCKTRKDNAL